MKQILFSPSSNCPQNFFTGDNLAHYHLGKYLWYVCNFKKQGFQEPIYHAQIQEDINLFYIFFSYQPQCFYFKKPKWIDAFLLANSEYSINLIARNYDLFVNQYRYRGRPIPETNCGYSPDLHEINLHLPAIVYKSVFDENLYLDDLLLSDKYAEFLRKIKTEMAPNEEPIFVLHHRGSDPWYRHQPFSIEKYEQLLFTLLPRFPDHVFVLVGEDWKQYNNPRIKHLSEYINIDRCMGDLKEHNACLQYILSAYFCRDADYCLVGISGFSLFIESIRPLDLRPPVPVFWNPIVFDGECTLIKMVGWRSEIHETYKKKNPFDIPYQSSVHHFLYYSRNEPLLKKYCFDNPNNIEKILSILDALK